MNQESIIKIFEEQDAFRKGHFKLSSGLHTEYYLQCALVLADPKIAASLCGELAEKFKGENINVVVGPAIGGITAAYEVARALGARGIFSEREDRKMVLRRGFKLEPGERVLVIEDVTTTGGSAQEVVDLAKELGAEVTGVGAIIDRSGGKAKFSVPFKSLAQLKIETFQPEDCPLCRAGKPITKPGSRK